MNIFSSIILILSILIFILFIQKNKTILRSQKILTTALILSIASYIGLFSYYWYNWETHKNTQVDEKRVMEVVSKELSKKFPDRIYQTKKIKDVGVKQDLTKQSALETLTYLLNETQVDKTNSNLSTKDRFDKLSEDTSKYSEYISNNVLDRIYLTDIINNDETMGNTTMVLLSFISLITENKTIEITPKLNSLDAMYLDKETMTANIPIDFFTGKPGAMSFQMVYVDNQWKLSPYTLLQSVQLSDFYATATQNKLGE